MQTAASPSPWSSTAYLAGARACIAVAISVAAYGLVWGVLARQAGLSLLEVVLMSGLVFAGSAQFVALDLWTATPSTLPIGPIVLATLIVNLRYLLLTATLRPLVHPGTEKRSALAMWWLSDENWAMTVAAMARGRGSIAFMVGGGTTVWCFWMASTIAGRLIGSVIDDPTRYGFDFAFTATFLALLLGMWKGKADLLPWLAAALVAVVSARLIPGSWYILVGGIAGSLVGAIAETRSRHARQS
ncbi:AzlC family ABC transporter permease [uncultured Devosia sp.]|uniref:AzlC family ABC transporter permease n=1 Tax=uncultured Devosia sp. TaxID=211434 RepID=UPI0035CADD72